MSIADKLNKLDADILDSYDAVEEQGGTVPTQKNTNNLGDAIRSIPKGGGITLESIAITQVGTTEYESGDTFSLSGYTIIATYSNGNTLDVTSACTFTPSGALSGTDTSITIKYIEGGVSATVTQAIEVSDSPYTELEYIEDSGTQWIDTGVKNSATIKVIDEITANPSAEKYSGCDYRSSYTATANARFKWCIGNVFYVGYATNNPSVNNTSDILKWYRYTVARGTQKIENITDNTTIMSHTYTTSMSYSTKHNILLFALWEYDSQTTPNLGTGSMRRRRTQIYDGDTLIRDLVPRIRKEDNVIGMLDLVNDVFYENAGTGVFLGA